MTDLEMQLLEALKLTVPYVERAYECAFPDPQENEYVLKFACEAIAKAEPKP